MRVRVLLAAGFLTALTAFAAGGYAPSPASAASEGGMAGPAAGSPIAASRLASGSTAGCTADAIRAIRARQPLTSVPPPCQGLSPSQRNLAAGLAIRVTSLSATKSATRKLAAAAAPYVGALISHVPAAPPTSPASSASSGPAAGGGDSAAVTSRLGFSERAAQLGALLAWLAAAASGGWILSRWWRAGGRLRRPGPRPSRPRAGTAGTAGLSADSAVPSAVVVGHAGLALLGLATWAAFMATGWAALAWVAVGLLTLIAGLGMALLFGGLPGPRSTAPARALPILPPAPRPSPEVISPNGNRSRGTALTLAPAYAPARSAQPRSRRYPVAAIAAHGLFVVATLLLVLLATIGA